MPTLFYRDPVSSNFLPVVGGGNDHGNLFGLADNDHPQYVLKTGDTMTGNLTTTGVVLGSSLLKGTTYLSARNSTDSDYVELYAKTPTFDFDNKVPTIAWINAKGFRPIYASTGAPTGGANGDVWLVYT